MRQVTTKKLPGGVWGLLTRLTPGWFGICFKWLIALSFLSEGWARLAQAYTPDSPEVQRIVARALAFLEKKAADDPRVGAHALVGLAFMKAGYDANHPVVVGAIDVVRKNVPRPVGDRWSPIVDIYSAGLAVVFLVNLDANRYRPEIEGYLAFLRAVQKPHGGWGYDGRGTGDTSMTQYAVLAMWEAVRAGIPIPSAMLTGVTMWLIRTQDPSGAFGYQGEVSPDFNLIPQKEIRHSLATAGLASLYVLADLMGLSAQKEERESGLPPIVREVQRLDPTGRAETRVAVDPRLVQAAINRGKAWQAANYRIDVNRFRYYYLYALERYWTYRELVEGKPKEAPTWYDDGVRFLRETQREDGSWEHECTPVPDTAFGVLFLVRSTLKSVERVKSFGEGTLVGGRGLPRNTSQVAIIGGNVVAKPELANLEKLMEALQKDEDPEQLAALELLTELPAEQAGAILSKQGQKLLELAGSNAVEARLAAIRAMARSGNLDYVPTLIFALSDADPTIVRGARDALRRLSRRFDLGGPPDNATPAQLQEAIRQWREWYLTIRPDAEFVE